MWHVMKHTFMHGDIFYSKFAMVQSKLILDIFFKYFFLFEACFILSVSFILLLLL